MREKILPKKAVYLSYKESQSTSPALKGQYISPAKKVSLLQEGRKKKQKKKEQGSHTSGPTKNKDFSRTFPGPWSNL